MREASLRREAAPARMSYGESKRLLRDRDPRVRADLASRADLRPEILFFLAGDESADVRRQVAGNPRTPAEADLLLARDADQDVRSDLAEKVARLVPEDCEVTRRNAHSAVVDTLEVLAQDQTTRVRRILAETLKDLAAAPASVIGRLARDQEAIVACPVLEFSPLLSEEDLLEIIEESGVSAKLCAISRRHGLGHQVTDAIAASDDEGAVAALLSNQSAQIREETLDQLVEQAENKIAWHDPLVRRPQLSGGAARKLAGFVARNLLERLEAREDLDAETLRAVGQEVQRRLVSDAQPPEEEPEEDDDGEDEEAIALRVARLQGSGGLSEEIIGSALSGGERAFVRHALAQLAGQRVTVVEKILFGGSAKGQTALVWQAGLTMQFAAKLQVRMGGIAPQNVLRADADGGFPLSEEEMNWQLGLFGSLSE